MRARAGAAAQVFVEDLDRLRLEADDEHHLVQVLRLREGEPVVATDGRGQWRLCRMGARAAGPAQPGAQLVADGPLETEPAPVPALTVAFAPVKGDRPEWVIQKLTEIGVDRIVPLMTERSVVRWAGTREEKVISRLRRVAREAAAQSRRVWLPVVTESRTLRDLAGELATEGHELAVAQLGAPPPDDRCTAVAVGPEGGWSPAELGAATGAVGLGTQVLRSETAAVVASALLAGLRAGTVATTVEARETKERSRWPTASAG